MTAHLQTPRFVISICIQRPRMYIIISIKPRVNTTAVSQILLAPDTSSKHASQPIRYLRLKLCSFAPLIDLLVKGLLIRASQRSEICLPTLSPVRERQMTMNNQLLKKLTRRQSRPRPRICPPAIARRIQQHPRLRSLLILRPGRSQESCFSIHPNSNMRHW